MYAFHTEQTRHTLEVAVQFLHMESINQSINPLLTMLLLLLLLLQPLP